MHITNKRLHPEMREILGHALLIAPAVLLGVLAMIHEGVSPMLWGQQLAAFFMFAPLGLLRCRAQKLSASLFSAVCLLALAASFLFPPVGGARRWLDLGIVNVNAGMLVLPALTVLLCRMNCMYPALYFTAAALCVQPDLSQLAACSLGALPILWQKRKRTLWASTCALFLLACCILCANIPTALEPVSYCEGILSVLGSISPLMQFGGWLALALIPAGFFIRFFRHKSPADLSLALYYTTVILFSLTGEYPVPFMGFGLSPIAGYWLAHLFLPQMHK